MGDWAKCGTYHVFSRFLCSLDVADVIDKVSAESAAISILPMDVDLIV